MHPYAVDLGEPVPQLLSLCRNRQHAKRSEKRNPQSVFQHVCLPNVSPRIVAVSLAGEIVGTNDTIVAWVWISPSAWAHVR
jgi:hypothetical protein